MAELCNCDEGQEEHEHCKDCDGILKYNESENYCCWCEERRAKEKGASHMGKEITLTDFTNSELDYLAEMIHEKLQNMGHDPDGGFSFDVIVHFEEQAT